jgi:ADP-ribose pyrophosphatase
VGEFRPEPANVIHEWGSWSLVNQSFLAPGGESFERTFVRSPGVVAVVALDGDGPDARIVLLRQYRPSVGESLWEIPAGMRDVPGETPRETAERELVEETGYRARTWTHLGTVVPSPGTSSAVVDLFVASDLSDGMPRPQGPEESAMSMHLVPLGEAKRMVDDGEIVNALAVIGVLKVACRRD